MKTIYIVRHGESEGNIGNFRQGAETPLSDNGIKQSEKIAKRLKKLDFDLLVASPLKRTVQTADLIKAETGHDFILSDLFIERKRPSRQYGLKKDSKLHDQIEKEFNKILIDGGKFEDAESFSEIKDRVIAALDFLENRPEQKIVVVTHGTFSRFLAALLILGKENMNPKNSIRITKVLKKTNTGISVFIKEKIWRIYSWNDFSHFDDFEE